MAFVRSTTKIAATVGALTVTSLLLSASSALAIDKCKAKVNKKTGVITVDVSGVGGQVLWGATAGAAINAFFNEAGCDQGSNWKRCEIGDPATLAGKTPPAACTLHLDDGIAPCSVWIGGCTPGPREVSIDLQQVAVDITQLQTDVATTDEAISSLNTTISGHTTSINSLNTTVGGHTTSINSLNTTVGSHTASINSLNTTVSGHTTSINSLNTTVGGHTTSISTLNTKTQCMTANATDTFITNCNLHVRNGSNATYGAANGRGNLIVGYNENSSDTKTGSHNVVIGQGHTYTGRAGLVAGENNALTGNGSFVAGAENTASGQWSSVSGGRQNAASGQSSSVSGGYQNVASGLYASVSAGQANAAGGIVSSITGGDNNTTAGNYDSISGGRCNYTGTGTPPACSSATAFGADAASISGGRANRVSAIAAWVGGGKDNWAAGFASSVSGGANNSPTGGWASIAGGSGLTALGDATFVAGDSWLNTVNIYSDRNAKEAFTAIAASDVLNKVVALPIGEWQYKTQPGVRHVGPMAQDFRAAFQVGQNERGIATVDADGVALAAIQGLHELVMEQRAEMNALQGTLDAMCTKGE